jgi:NitT/TauT family transport system ATP-binding protein
MPFGVIRNARKVFPVNELGKGAREDLVALDDASFTFEQGEFISLLGPSGCGKTTLLRIVAGLIPLTSGEVTVGGRSVEGPYSDYGFVFQSPSLMPWRSVLDNVLYPMEVLGRLDASARLRARELLQLVGLASFEKARPHQLSGGMQQRVSLCRALIHAPKLLLMDEPFGALDELTRMEMNDLLLRIRQETQASVLFVTHSISEAIYLADRVLVFSRRPARVALQLAVDLPVARHQGLRFTPAFSAAERAASVALGIVTPESTAPAPMKAVA